MHAGINDNDGMLVLGCAGTITAPSKHAKHVQKMRPNLRKEKQACRQRADPMRVPAAWWHGLRQLWQLLCCLLPHVPALVPSQSH